MNHLHISGVTVQKRYSGTIRDHKNSLGSMRRKHVMQHQHELRDQERLLKYCGLHVKWRKNHIVGRLSDWEVRKIGDNWQIKHDLPGCPAHYDRLLPQTIGFGHWLVSHGYHVFMTSFASGIKAFADLAKKLED